MKRIKAMRLALVAILVVGIFFGCGSLLSAANPKLTIAVSIRSLSSEYHMQYVEGAKTFIASLPEGAADLQVLPCDANDDKQINDIKALLARTGGNCILFVDPNNAPNITAIAQMCEQAHVYWTSAWNIPKGISPMDYKYWVSFQSCDGVKQGYDLAVTMIKAFKTPGKGRILAMQGMLGNTAAVERFQGLKKALKEYPGVKMLDQQAGDWDTKKALSITETWLAKYKNIDGIWCACDDMGIGIIQALKARGLNGKVLVTGNDGTKDAINAVESGDMVCTIANNGWMQGGYGVAYAYAAYTGKFNVEKAKARQRMFYTNGFLITKDTLQEYKEKFVVNKPKYDFNNLAFPIARPYVIKK